MSVGFLKESWMRPSALASVNSWASAGETRRVMTGTSWGLPSLSRCSLLPAARTGTFCRTVVVVVFTASELLVGFPVTMTSTCVPGTTKPATETTSLTLTETARMPWVIIAGKPAPSSAPAILVLSTTSFACMGSTTPRPITWDKAWNAPWGRAATAMGITRTSASVINWPTFRSLAAMTTWVSAGVAIARRTMLTIFRLTKPATNSAINPSKRNRFRFIVPPTASLIRFIEISEFCRTLQGEAARHPKPCKDREIIHRVGVIDCHHGRAHGNPARRGNRGCLVNGHVADVDDNAVLGGVSNNFAGDVGGVAKVFLIYGKPGALASRVVEHLMGAHQARAFQHQHHDKNQQRQQQSQFHHHGAAFPRSNSSHCASPSSK